MNYINEGHDDKLFEAHRLASNFFQLSIYTFKHSYDLQRGFRYVYYST